MAERVRVTIGVTLFVEDERAMREAAHERLRGAWKADEDFPYAESDDVPFDQVVSSLIAQALPLELAGCRRGSLTAETERLGATDADEAADQPDDEAADDTEDKATDDAEDEAADDSEDKAADDRDDSSKS